MKSLDIDRVIEYMNNTYDLAVELREIFPEINDVLIIGDNIEIWQILTSIGQVANEVTGETKLKDIVSKLKDCQTTREKLRAHIDDVIPDISPDMFNGR